MLHFNQSREEEAEEGGVWKLLILDQAGSRIISPLLRLNDLREEGVTLYPQLHSDRQPVEDVPVVYFVEPTRENIERILADLQAGLYNSPLYLNWTTSIPRPLLERLAEGAANRAPLIAKVYDQYLNFVCLEDNLFTLNLAATGGGTWATLNAPSTAEAAVEACLDQIALGLWCVLMAQGGPVPLLLCQRGGPSQAIANRLEARIRTHLINTRNSHSLGPTELQHLEEGRPGTLRLA